MATLLHKQFLWPSLCKTGSAESCPREAEPRNNQEISLGAGLTPAALGRWMMVVFSLVLTGDKQDIGREGHDFNEN